MASYKQTFMMIIVFFSYAIIVTTSNPTVEDLKEQCLDVMKKYFEGCNCHDPHGIELVGNCVRKAIYEFSTNMMNNIPEEDAVVKKYYESFKGNMNLSAICNVTEFCQKWDKFGNMLTTQCMNDLKDFGETKEDAINAALYSFTYKQFKDLDTIRKESFESSSSSTSVNDDNEDDDDYSESDDERITEFQKTHFGYLYICHLRQYIIVDDGRWNNLLMTKTIIGNIKEPVDFCDKHAKDLLKKIEEQKKEQPI